MRRVFSAVEHVRITEKRSQFLALASATTLCQFPSRNPLVPPLATRLVRITGTSAGNLRMASKATARTAALGGTRRFPRWTRGSTAFAVGDVSLPRPYLHHLALPPIRLRGLSASQFRPFTDTFPLRDRTRVRCKVVRYDATGAESSSEATCNALGIAHCTKREPS